MFLTFIVNVGILTIPIWGIVFCINLISIIEKIKKQDNYNKNAFWFTFSFVVIITVLTFITIYPTPPS